MSNSETVPHDLPDIAQANLPGDLSSKGLHSFILGPSNDLIPQPSSDAAEADAETGIQELEVAPENQPLEERDA